MEPVILSKKHKRIKKIKHITWWTLVGVYGFLLLFGIACTPEAQHVFSERKKNVEIKGIKTTIIDGCEYLVKENGEQGSMDYSLSLTHKGNCKNKCHYQK